MGGSSAHVVADDGQLLGNEDFGEMIGNLGFAGAVLQKPAGGRPSCDQLGMGDAQSREVPCPSPSTS